MYKFHQKDTGVSLGEVKEAAEAFHLEQRPIFARAAVTEMLRVEFGQYQYDPDGPIRRQQQEPFARTRPVLLDDLPPEFSVSDVFSKNAGGGGR
jgi:hypothetical protein